MALQEVLLQSIQAELQDHITMITLSIPEPEQLSEMKPQFQEIKSVQE